MTELRVPHQVRAASFRRLSARSEGTGRVATSGPQTLEQEAESLPACGHADDSAPAAARITSEHVDGEKRPEIGARLGAIAGPTLVIVGDADTRKGVEGVERAQDLTRAIPGAYMKVTADCGHFYGFEQPAATVDAITRFLAAFT